MKRKAIERRIEPCIPEWLVWFNDLLPKYLPADKAAEKSAQLIDALRLDSQLDLVWNQWAIYLCDFVRPYVDYHEVLDTTKSLHQRVLAGDQPAAKEWSKARGEFANNLRHGVGYWAANPIGETGGLVDIILYEATLRPSFRIKGMEKEQARRIRINAMEQITDELIRLVRSASE